MKSIAYWKTTSLQPIISKSHTEPTDKAEGEKWRKTFPEAYSFLLVCTEINQSKQPTLTQSSACPWNESINILSVWTFNHPRFLASFEMAKAGTNSCVPVRGETCIIRGGLALYTVLKLQPRRTHPIELGSAETQGQGWSICSIKVREVPTHFLFSTY